jgi:hypothetical protein
MLKICRNIEIWFQEPGLIFTYKEAHH